MRIAFATHAYAPAIGGAERYAQGLAEAFALMGHEIYVLTPNRISAESFYEYGHRFSGAGAETINGVDVKRIDLTASKSRWKRTPRTGPLTPETASAMWDAYGLQIEIELDRIRPDATVALPHSFPNVSAALNASSSGVTVYAPLLHEEDPAWRIDPIKELVARSDVVLAMTTWERDRLVDAYGASPQQTCVAPPTISPPPFEAVEPYECDLPYVVAIGRRTRSKDLLATARAVDTMNSDGRRIRLIVAGPGSDALLDRELRNFDRSVDLLGEISEQMKWGLIKGSIASVSMSVSESFGIGIAEAWAMRRPAIARRVGALESVVDEGVNGYLVEDEQDLTDRLETLLTNPAEADRIGAEGSRMIEDSEESSAPVVLSAISGALIRRYNHPINGGGPSDGS